MNHKTINRVNGGIAIYYGFGLAILAIASLIAICVWIFQVITGAEQWSWGMFGGLLFLAILVGSLAYVILRTGYEQIEQ